MTCPLLNEKRETMADHLSLISIFLIVVYFSLIISFFEKTRNQADNIIVLALVLGIASFFFKPVNRNLLWPYYLFIISVIGFYGANSLSNILAPVLPNMGHTSSRVLGLPEMISTVSVAVCVRTQKQARWLLTCMLVIGLIWYLGELVHVLIGSNYFDNRLIGSRDYHTTFGMELVIMFAAAFSMGILSSGYKKTLLFLIGAILIGTLLILNQTRFALLTVIFVTVPTAAFLQKRIGTLKNKIIIVLVLVFIAGPAASLVWYYNASAERRSLVNIKSRFGAWEVLYNITKKSSPQRIILGHGKYTKTFSASIEHYKAQNKIVFHEKPSHAHNIFMQTFLETGLVGIFVFLLIFGISLFRAGVGWKGGNSADKVVSGSLIVILVSIIVMGQLDYCFWRLPGRFCWLMLGLAFASGSIENTSKTDTKTQVDSKS